MERSKDKLNQFSLIFVYVIFFVGIIGHLFDLTIPLMLLLTPFTLLLANFVIILPQLINRDVKAISWMLIVYLITFTLEVIGVKTGLVFGAYNYGSVLGTQLFDVPLIIGFNWMVIIFSLSVLLSKLKWNTFLLAGTGGLLAVLLDLFIEPIAIKLGYWQWDGGEIPLQNYFAWFVISFFSVLSYKFFKVNVNSRIAPHYYFIQLIFFISLFVFM